jgi:hypothetical protein
MNWLDWGSENCITIYTDPEEVREGFFLLGFDYTKTETNEDLMIATRVEGYEYFYFNNYNLSRGDVIWMK